jgi:hypothetical protein
LLNDPRDESFHDSWPRQGRHPVGLGHGCSPTVVRLLTHELAFRSAPKNKITWERRTRSRVGEGDGSKEKREPQDVAGSTAPPSEASEDQECRR